MSEERDTPTPGQPDKDEATLSREEKLAQIKARADALRAARAGGGAKPAPARPSPAAPPTPPAAAASGHMAAAEASEGSAPPPDGGDAGELTREQKLAAIKARAEALKAARAGGAPASAPAGAPPAGRTAAAPAKPAAPASLEVPVTSLNPGGRPGAAPQVPALEVFGTLNQSVEIKADAVENDNVKKLLGGLGAYQNPLRGDVWQIDYRYYAEARQRLEAAGYTITEADYLGRPLSTWNPVARGWTRVES